MTVKEVCSELEELYELLLVDEALFDEFDEDDALLDDELEEAEALVEVCPLLLVVLDDVETGLVHPEMLIPSSARTATM